MKKTYVLKLTGLLICTVAAAILLLKGLISVNEARKTFVFTGTAVFYPASCPTERDKNKSSCPVEFKTADGKYKLTSFMSYEEWLLLPENAEIRGRIYENKSGVCVALRLDASDKDILGAMRGACLRESSALFGAAQALWLFTAGLALMFFFGSRFTAYEQRRFISVLGVAAALSVIFPQQEINGINGLVITALYLADTFLNILCELLISKQSKWNFIVSVFVELTEIAACILLAYRFATLATTLFFWLPIDIISFISWHRRPDRVKKELTVVRTLKGWQEAVIISGIVLWTIGVGFLLTSLDFGTELFDGSRTKEIAVCFLDAAASAVGIANGVFILLRLREQWIAWFINAALETVINILSGQYVLLALKAGYFTNTAYGYVKWTEYIKQRTEKKRQAEV